MHLMKQLHSSTNREERTTLVNRSMNIRTLTMVSARCQVHLGMLAKANKFSRVLALQNSSKGDGMSKMRLVNSKHVPFWNFQFWNPQKARPTGNKTQCFVSRLFTARLLCLIGSKSLCALKRVLTLAKANSLFSKNVLKPKPMCV